MAVTPKLVNCLAIPARRSNPGVRLAVVVRLPGRVVYTSAAIAAGTS